MKKLIAVAALALPLLTAGYASAGEPLRLTDDQMDGVSAGGSALGISNAFAAGGTAITTASTFAQVAAVAAIPLQATTVVLVNSTSSATAQALQ